ncbi:MAG TPA: arylamine N-acetyltransferase, partial [Pyrinomonadaceae bacterium]|nr:arylamine N-acetyltransferase [Pyrinomonadaceae bacterium]
KNQMDVNTYLKRIDYDGPVDVSTETLRNLQVAHLLHVPFENLSIHAGEPIVLDDEALFAKIVERRRGGFCYEANGLFAALLRALGFDVSMLSAEVARGNGGFSPPFDHMALLVNLENRWLVDVGFGDSFLEPLLLDTTSEQIQGDQSFKIESEDQYCMVFRRNNDEWEPMYRFTLEPHQFADYEEMCRFHQTSPQSHFTQNRICSRATPAGRITLSGMRLIVTTKHGREERLLDSAKEYEEVLRDQFGIANQKS